MLYNIYCDESCHLERDGESKMVLGSIYCKDSDKKQIIKEIKEIKSRFGLCFNKDLNENVNDYYKKTELKWTKLSNQNIDLYIEIIKYFFTNDKLNFRCVVADKTNLKHSQFNQDHNTWYYKMYYLLLDYIIKQDYDYNVYLDIKDNTGNKKISKLRECIFNSNNEKNVKIQHIRSHESEILQICDILIGSVSYVNRQISKNPAKIRLSQLIIDISKEDLFNTNHNLKFNIFHWTGAKWNSKNKTCSCDE